MHISTSLILFATVITGAFHMVTVSATPYSRTESRYPTSSVNRPNTLKGRSPGKDIPKPDDFNLPSPSSHPPLISQWVDDNISDFPLYIQTMIEKHRESSPSQEEYDRMWNRALQLVNDRVRATAVPWEDVGLWHYMKYCQGKYGSVEEYMKYM
ncbi:hypothetical protein BC835DRAFT_963115 [Cytidiella melzeri]|nr:hypothetical protein BC835DRAFT_963115 [Cytidiella melzeri]